MTDDTNAEIPAILEEFISDLQSKDEIDSLIHYFEGSNVDDASKLRRLHSLVAFLRDQYEGSPDDDEDEEDECDDPDENELEDIKDDIRDIFHRTFNPLNLPSTKTPEYRNYAETVITLMSVTEDSESSTVEVYPYLVGILITKMNFKKKAASRYAKEICIALGG